MPVGSLCGMYAQMWLTEQALQQCTACSSTVMQQNQQHSWSFLSQALQAIASCIIVWDVCLYGRKRTSLPAMHDLLLHCGAALPTECLLLPNTGLVGDNLIAQTRLCFQMCLTGQAFMQCMACLPTVVQTTSAQICHISQVLHQCMA